MRYPPIMRYHDGGELTAEDDQPGAGAASRAELIEALDQRLEETKLFRNRGCREPLAAGAGRRGPVGAGHTGSGRCSLHVKVRIRVGHRDAVGRFDRLLAIQHVLQSACWCRKTSSTATSMPHRCRSTRASPSRSQSRSAAPSVARSRRRVCPLLSGRGMKISLRSKSACARLTLVSFNDWKMRCALSPLPQKSYWPRCWVKCAACIPVPHRGHVAVGRSHGSGQGA